MSYTELFGLTKNSVLCIGEIRNSWRGAMAVWVFLEKKYLPKYTPDWAVKSNIKCSRTTSMDEIEDIWKLFESTKLTKAERIVLGSTFDKVLVKVEDKDELLLAFREFEGETSLKEQADLIEKAIKEKPEIVAIGWNQTSVCGDTWATENYNEETEDYAGYNLETGNKHWFLFPLAEII